MSRLEVPGTFTGGLEKAVCLTAVARLKCICEYLSHMECGLLIWSEISANTVYLPSL